MHLPVHLSLKAQMTMMTIMIAALPETVAMVAVLQVVVPQVAEIVVAMMIMKKMMILLNVIPRVKVQVLPNPLMKAHP